MATASEDTARQRKPDPNNKDSGETPESAHHVLEYPQRPERRSVQRRLQQVGFVSFCSPSSASCQQSTSSPTTPPNSPPSLYLRLCGPKGVHDLSVHTAIPRQDPSSNHGTTPTATIPRMAPSFATSMPAGPSPRPSRPPSAPMDATRSSSTTSRR